MRRLYGCRFTAVLVLVCLTCGTAGAGEGKLLATPGVTQVEGAGGGGIVPWATLAGYATREEIAVSAFYTYVNVDDYRLGAGGVSVNLYDRAELSYARHEFRVQALDTSIHQDIFGAKFRLAGDLVYSRWPQVSAGIQYKKLRDPAIAGLLGARDTDHGIDYYLVASKLHLGAVAGYNLLWSAALRATRANQLGLLGHGGDRDNGYQVVGEASLALLLGRHIAVGVEYRQKPDNLGSAGEQDWRDVFVAYIPNKHFNITLAYADLGEIAGQPDQSGLYLSVTGYPW